MATDNFKNADEVRIGTRVHVHAQRVVCDGKIVNIAYASDDHSARIAVLLDPKGLRFWRKIRWYRPYEVMIFHKRAEVRAFPLKEPA